MTSLTVAEAPLTGESAPVAKAAAKLDAPAALGDRANMVFDGTAVTRGRGRAVVTATGMATEMGNIASLLGTTEEQRTPLQREVSRIGRMLGVAVIAIAVVVVAAILVTADVDSASDLVDVLLVGVALAVAAVPEGLPAVLSVVLALGVQRMARRRAIVKRLSSVETLGSASVICSDKTGTLTKNEMTVRRIVTASGEVEVTGDGYLPEERISSTAVRRRRGAGRGGALLIRGPASRTTPCSRRATRWIIHGDPTDAALLVAEARSVGSRRREDHFERLGEAVLRGTKAHDHGPGRRPETGVAIVTNGAPRRRAHPLHHESARRGRPSH